jgi:adenylosuccinate lyase
MISRYTRPEMANVFKPDRRFDWMLKVEIAVAEAQAARGLIPHSAAKSIREKAKFDVARIDEIEKTTKHDVIAFVSCVAENVGTDGRWIHFGLTSSDVLDTALSLQAMEAITVLQSALGKLITALQHRAQAEAETLCAGRTHGMHAEPTTFGMKLAGFWAEFRRHEERLKLAYDRVAIGKLSGAVGTYSTQTHEIEFDVCRSLGLKPETIATQVIPRDRLAEVFSALALLGGGIERLAVEMRHLQRTELSEAIESFSKGQKGSSAMPHKKNPITAENLTGVARLLRSYAQASFENMALWHERDISHSSVERVIVPDAFILAHYACERMTDLVNGLEIQSEQMIENMNRSGGMLFSSHLLLALVETGMSREDAYSHVQRLSHGLKAGEQLRDAATADGVVGKLISKEKIADVFSGRRHREAVRGALERAGLWSAK